MRLRGQEWGPVFNASGARGFWGEGYWFHKLWKPFGLDYRGSTFVAKTTTLNPRAGNMPLDEHLRPKELAPKCIVVKPLKGVVLNSVGLSGPGIDKLIDTWAWQSPPKKPWVVSFMSVAATADERLNEARQFFEKLPALVRLHGSDNLALQINFSCPNVGLDPLILVSEVVATLSAAENLGVPVLIKLNALVTPTTAMRMVEHPACDGVVMSNTIPWGKLSYRIDWKGLFGTNVSPLAHLGGGGLSGAPLLPIVGDWVKEARRIGLEKPIIAGGGILSRSDAEYMLDMGADGIELGSVPILRPWRVSGIISYVNTRLKEPKPKKTRGSTIGNVYSAGSVKITVKGPATIKNVRAGTSIDIKAGED